MTIYFSETFKKLRLQKELTQEQVADVFCVSPQAVSRWECGTTTPDISLLPTIADYFDVSIEELLGVEKTKRELRIHDYFERFDTAMKHGHISDCIEIARAGVKEFPNDYPLMNKLMYALFVSGADDGNIPNWQENRENYKFEIIELGEKILQGCTDDSIRLEVKSRLGFHYCEMGNLQKGSEIIKSLPSLNSCREYNLDLALTGNEKKTHISKQIALYTYQLVWNIGKYIRETNLSPKEKLSYMETMEQIIRNVYKENALDEWYFLLPRLYLEGETPILLAIGDTKTALALVEKSVDYLEIYENLPSVFQRKSPLLSFTDYRKFTDTADSRSQTRILLEDVLSKNCFDSLREHPRFVSAVDRMKSFA